MKVNGRVGLLLRAFLIFLSCTAAAQADQEQLRKRVGSVHVPFIANRGQTNPAVAYYAPTFAGTVYVTTKGEIVYSLPAPSEDETGSSLIGKSARAGWTLTETAVRGKARVAAERPGEAQVSYFIGNDPARWRSGIPTHESVGLGEVWPGVFLSLQAHGDNVEKLFTVQPGAEPSLIRMRIAGAKSLRVNEAGALVATTGLGEVTFTPPVAYQEQDGLRRAVRVSYRARGREYGFSLGSHDPALPLVIDPLLQATYLGGSGEDYISDLAIRPTTGEVFVTGTTYSIDFPGTAGGALPELRGSPDTFVARLNATLTTLLQATYLGGSGNDIGDFEGGSALAIDPTTGEVFVTGSTNSANFPGTAGGAQPTFGGEASEAFVARLNATLSTLLQATYLGGSGGESSHGLVIHPTTGEVFVAGETVSTDFPGTAGGAQPAYGGGGRDAFVARLNSTLTTLLQATYLGGSGGDAGFDVAIHAASNQVFVAGYTAGYADTFPGTTGGAQPSRGGLGDDFVARLDATLTALHQATYLGGSGWDECFALSIHPTLGDVFVAGRTLSTDFPGTAGGAQPTNGGSYDAYVARLNASLTTLLQATYLGGSGDDYGFGLAVHPISDEVFVAGDTSSANFPGTAGGALPAIGGSSDAFVTRLSPTLTSLTQATYLGGSGSDAGSALAIHPTSGAVYVTGSTASVDFPGTAGGAESTPHGSFVARLSADLLEATLVPAAMAVDPSVTAVSNGNGVLEPGETVAVQPEWQNVDDFAHALTGAASELTGPAGATYELLDDSAAYGTIAPGDTRSCDATLDCYSISVSSPSIRPLQHWDATFVETPSAGNFVKERTLHIGSSFPDVPTTNIFYGFIESLFHDSVTGGCAGGNYCPGASVTRGQMAVFLLKAEHGSVYVPLSCAGTFPDVACPSLFADWIEQLAIEGITAGCGGGLYCPDSPVTRRQMAIFLLKTREGTGYTPPAATGIFGDVPQGDDYAPWVEELYNRNITGGCQAAPLLYCPGNPNVRGQMAVFLVKTFGLRVYGP